MEKLTKNSPVGKLPGIGASRAAAFARMGILTLYDLIMHFPRAYENRGAIRRLCDGVPGEASAFLLTVGTEPKSVMIRRGMTLTKFRAFDESGAVEIVFFNQNYLRDVFHVGSVFRFYGRLTLSRSGAQLSSPSYEPYLPSEPLPAYVARYPLTEGLSDKVVEKAVTAALRAVLPTLSDHLPEAVRQRQDLPTLSYALLGIHAPQSEEMLSRAMRRMIFDELYCFSVGMALSRESRAEEKALPCPACDLTPLLSRLPYRLTGAPARVVEEIRADMAAADRPPMNRILVGDVGSGKTVCAAAAIYTAARAGLQSAMMVPTEILARQHFADLSPLLSPLGLRVELLLGATTEKEKKN